MSTEQLIEKIVAKRIDIYTIESAIRFATQVIDYPDSRNELIALVEKNGHNVEKLLEWIVKMTELNAEV